MVLLSREDLIEAIYIAIKDQLGKTEIGKKLGGEISPGCVVFNTVKVDENTFNLSMRGVVNVADIKIIDATKKYDIIIYDQNLWDVWGNLILMGICKANGLDFS